MGETRRPSDCHASREELAEHEEMFEFIDGVLGYVPSSLHAMGLLPDVLRHVGELNVSILRPGEVDHEVKWLVAQLRHFLSDTAIADIVAVIARFGFLNRWNDTMATSLEETALGFATHNLTAAGWDPGRHV